MRYAQGGGFTTAGQQRRERLRLKAAESFAHGGRNMTIARRLRVSRRSVNDGGVPGVRAAPGTALHGPPALPKLSDTQFARLERELEQGPPTGGFADQRWTPLRIKTLIGRRFPIGHTVQGVR